MFQQPAHHHLLQPRAQIPYLDEGSLIPVTAVETGPCVVTQVKKEANDGYNAIQLGFLTVKKVNNPKLGHLKGN